MTGQTKMSMDEESRAKVTGYGLPQTEKQRRYLYVVTDQFGWHSDQVRGRAREIVGPFGKFDEMGLDALNRDQMSSLIDAIKTEQPWVDPRQQRMEL